jgi:hypothetical protein
MITSFQNGMFMTFMFSQNRKTRRFINILADLIFIGNVYVTTSIIQKLNIIKALGLNALKKEESTLGNINNKLFLTIYPNTEND